jgi:hypothetical protein
MFEKQLALEKAQGYRGLATRLVGPILDVREADLVVRETCFILLGIAAVFIVISFKHGVANVVLAAIIGLPALITALTKNRVAAVILDLGVFIVGALHILVTSSNPWRLLFAVLLLLIAARASEAVFKRKRLLRGVEKPPVAFAPPSSPAV